MTRSLKMLGYEPTDRVLIIHADDVGFSHASNVAAFDGMAHGSLTCASTLVAAPWFAETARMCREQPGADMGVHLALNCEHEYFRWRSVTGHPSLHAPDGGVWRSVDQTLAHVSPEAARAEIFAQVQLALDLGVDVTHVDTHMGAVIRPEYLPSYVDAALEFRLPLFLFPPSDRWLQIVGPRWGAIWTEQVARLEANGWPLLDNIITETLSEIAPADKERRFREMFAGLRPGLTHFLVHPSMGGEEIEALDPINGAARGKEAELFTRPGLREYCESLGIRLTGYREIRDRLRAPA